MAKEKKQEQLSESAQLQAASDQQKPEAESPEALKARIAELEAKLAEGDEAALKRVAKAAGIDAQEVLDHEDRARTPKEALVEVDLGPHEVNVNGRIFRGKVEVPHSVAQVLNQAVGDKRMRHLRELVGKDYLVESLNGVHVSRVIGQINEHGERIA